MVAKAKIEINAKKLLEKLVVDVSKKVGENKKVHAKEEIKKVQPSGEDKKIDKLEARKLEEVVLNETSPSIDLKNIGLVKTNSPIIPSAANSKLENSVKDVASDSDKKKDQNQVYSGVKNNYNQQQSSSYEQNKKTTVQQGQSVLIPMTGAHSLESSNILRGQTPQRNVQMIHNPELEKESRIGYEPYHTSKLDNTSKKPWEQQEDRIKKYKQV